jgi:3-dehydroquinate dehydratase-2
MAIILLLSGPNLNLLGEREPEHYGTTTLEDLVTIASEVAAKRGYDVEHVHSNHEGALVDAIHGARGRCAAIVFNPGAFSHVYVVANLKGRRIPLDPTYRENPIGWQYPNPFRSAEARA